MNTLFWLAILITFLLSYLLGRRLKRYRFLLLAPVVGIVVAVPMLLLEVRFGDIERFGLGVIAVVPVFVIWIVFSGTVSSVVGISIGVFYGKQNLQKSNKE